MKILLVVITLLIAGCSKPPAQSIQARADLKAIVLQYHQYVDEIKRPPANVDELATFEDPYASIAEMNKESSLRCTTALRSGDYEVVWSYNVAEDLARNETVILAWHKSVPAEGGYTGFADGSARLLDKD